MDTSSRVAAASGVGGGSVDERGKPRRLGRGLSSLLGDLKPVPVASAAVEPAPASGDAKVPLSAGDALPGGVASGGSGGAAEGIGGGRVLHVAVGQVVASPFQPRRRFDEAALATLAASIRSAGVMQPVLVRRVGPAGSVGGASAGEVRYELIAGERRWRAAQQAGLVTVPALVVELADEEAAEHALIENMQREDLSALERSAALANLAARFGLTHAAIAEKIGLDRATVTNLIRLNELEPAIQQLLEQGSLLAGHGKALLGYPPGTGREALAQRAAVGGWSVRRLERAVAAREAEPPVEVAATGEAALAQASRRRQVGDLERALSDHLGTKVEIKTDAGGARGRIQVAFYDLDQFEGVVARMGLRLPTA